MNNTIKAKIIDELYRPARKNFPRRAIEIRGLDDSWQTDLIDIQSYASQNKKHRYILICINSLSKFAYAEPLLNKRGETVATAMRKILERAREIPRNICSDLGKEYYNAFWKQLMKEYNIHHYSTFSVKKASLAERFIKTIKMAIYKNFQLQGSFDWLTPLPRLIDEYNNTVHGATGFKPKDVTKKQESTILKRLKAKTIKAAAGSILKPGSFVRISKYRNIFQKSYDISWSTEVFRIVKRVDSHPPVYLLNSLDNTPILGSFYRQELQPTKIIDHYLVEKVIRRKGNKALVRWLGFAPQYDSWVDNF